MNRPVKLLIAAGAMLSVATVSSVRTTPHVGRISAQDTMVSFARQIMPIFERTCWECHGGEDENGEVFAEVDLYLTTYDGVMKGSESGTVIEAGSPGDSFLFEMVEFGDMPQERDPLPPEEIALIRKWIEQGAQNN